MQNSPFAWFCNCTHMAISHGTDRSVERQQWKLNLGHADPAWGSGASGGPALSPVRQQEKPPGWFWTHFLFFFEPGLCYSVNVSSGTPGFAVQPQSWSLLWGAARRAQTWHGVHHGTEIWLWLTPCWSSSETLKSSILSPRCFPSSRCFLCPFCLQKYFKALKCYHLGFKYLLKTQQPNNVFLHGSWA